MAYLEGTALLLYPTYRRLTGLQFYGPTENERKTKGSLEARRIIHKRLGGHSHTAVYEQTFVGVAFRLGTR